MPPGLSVLAHTPQPSSPRSRPSASYYFVLSCTLRQTRARAPWQWGCSGDSCETAPALPANMGPRVPPPSRAALRWNLQIAELIASPRRTSNLKPAHTQALGEAPNARTASDHRGGAGGCCCCRCDKAYPCKPVVPAPSTSFIRVFPHPPPPQDWDSHQGRSTK